MIGARAGSNVPAFAGVAALERERSVEQDENGEGDL